MSFFREGTSLKSPNSLEDSFICDLNAVPAVDLFLRTFHRNTTMSEARVKSRNTSDIVMKRNEHICSLTIPRLLIRSCAGVILHYLLYY